MYTMKRTTMFFDEKLLVLLRRRAREEGVSYATLVREALVHYLAAPVTGGSVPSIAGKFASGTPDTASRVDEFLWRDPHL
jgi:hypothetical protein